MIPLDTLLGVRNDLSLVQYKSRCFALLLLENAADAARIAQFVSSINLYSPQRVLITHEYHTLPFAPVLVLEMHYCSNIQQTYFTYLVWHWSKVVPAWIHVWDTLEHDALRRDFPVPQYMDSELSANRLFIRRGEVFLVDVGYLPENPHGEMVAEISVEHAAQALAAGLTTSCPETTAAMAKLFGDAESHFINHVLDVQVLLPRNWTSLLRSYPYLLTWSRDVDLSYVDFSSVADLAPQNQRVYTVAIPDTPTCPNSIPGKVAAGKYATICIVSNVLQQFGTGFARGESEIDSFLSEYIMKQLELHDLGSSSDRARKVDSGDCIHDWSKPVSLITPEERQAAEKAAEDRDIGEIDSALEKVSKALDTDELYAGEHEPPETRAGLDVDDFVEFYAKHYLKMSDEDIAGHRVEPDWSAYNDDSDYTSE